MRKCPKFLFILVLLFYSCNTKHTDSRPLQESDFSTRDTTFPAPPVKKQEYKRIVSAVGDTTIVKSRSAVFFQPDSLQIEKRMKEAGEEEFRAGMDDYLYSMHVSSEYLDKKGLPVIDASGSRYLKFLMTDKKEKLIRIDTLEDLWGIFLFDPKKEPHYADIIEIEKDYENYYKQ